MKVDQEDVASGSVTRHLQQVDHALESGAARELPGDVAESNGRDRVDLDVAAVHAVTTAYLDMAALPDAHGTGDVAEANSLTQTPGKYHWRTGERRRG